MKRSNPKLKDYFIEFLIVLLGITIAFWLSNLGEAKKERALEKVYLEDLKNDLQDDLKSLEYSITNNKKKFSTLSKGIQYYQGVDNGLTLDSLVNYAGLIGNYFHFSPNDYTYISLQQSGDFRILSSQELKKSIIELYKLYEFIDVEQLNVLSALDLNYFPVLMENYDMVTGNVVNPDYFNSTFFRNNMGFTLNEVSTLIRLYTNAKQHLQSILDHHLKDL